MSLSQSIQTVSLTGLLMLPPVVGHAQQICRLDSIPATTPSSQFIDHGDGTVTDNKTGLMWKRCSEGQSWDGNTCTGTPAAYVWRAALQQAQTVNGAGGFADHADWRVPNIKELASLLEDQCVDPAINAEIFPTTPPGLSWSASPYAFSSYSVGNVIFYSGYYGYVNWNSKLNYNSLRLVRVGQ